MIDHSVLKPESTAEVLLCPPYVYLWETGRLIKDSDIELGAQNVCAETQGAFTGEVSAAMLRDVGCRYVLVGHSERRQIYGETDTRVARKFVAAQSQKLMPVLCVGETLDEREGGRTVDVVTRQIDAILAVSGVAALASAVIAYEPVWAIGTGRNATPAQAGEAHAHIRSRIRQWFGAPAADACLVIYGGSVKPDNIQSLITLPDVDGALVGEASLDVRAFHDIITKSRPAKV